MLFYNQDSRTTHNKHREENNQMPLHLIKELAQALQCVKKHHPGATPAQALLIVAQNVDYLAKPAMQSFAILASATR